MKRRLSRQVMCGDVAIGGGAPVSVQSMTSTDTRDAAATAGQIARLAAAGCDIVRCAVPDEAAAAALVDIRSRLSDFGVSVPLVADIHFDYRLAIAAIEGGADKIRINPGNIGSDARVREVVCCARAAGVPIRVGVNSGSLEKDISDRYGGATAGALCESAVRSIDRIAAMDFPDIVVSVKSSDVVTGIETMRLLAERTDFPLHLGVTEAGVGARALAKSAVGIGALLADGIGDTIRVSLTGDPVPEIAAARDILASVGMLEGAVDVIACPTCGRCRVDLPRIAAEVQAAVSALEGAQAHCRARAITVAVMGCAVNGPGEAAHADVGVACGDGSAVLFENGVKKSTISEEEIVPALSGAVRRIAAARK
jgi:(E)-4-hydroxy-3-methylbut-2-enyl-diphosphate synthase